MTATLTEVPREKKAKILRAVAASKYPRESLPVIASNHGLTIDQVKEVVQSHGWPNPGSMNRAAEVLERGPRVKPVVVDDTPEPTVEVPVPTGDRPDPYVTALPVAALFTDESYQRPLDQLRVQRMVTAYKVALVGIVEVSARGDGTYAILDGQHRWATVRDRAFDSGDENPHIPCRVHTGLTLAEEAQLYHQLNTTRKQLTGWDRWWARRGAGDEAVLAIEKVAADNGYVIGSNAGANILRSTKACENVVTLGGLPLLHEVLNTIRAAYAGDQNGLDVAIVYGLGHVIHAYTRDELDRGRLVEALTGIVPRQLTARAAAMREVHKGTMDRLTATVIVERYNATRGARLPAFAERVRPHQKTPTTAKGAEAREREAILEWAKRTGYPGRLDRCNKAMREAYAKAHQAAAS